MSQLPRLWWHTLLVVALFGGGVLGPLALLSRPVLGDLALVLGVVLIGIGSASFLGAWVSYVIDRGACTVLQWRFIIGSTWLLNPVLIIIIGCLVNHDAVVWWSGLPLSCALSAGSGRIQLSETEYNWRVDGCISLGFDWLFSRFIAIGFPMSLLTFQIVLYLASRSLFAVGMASGLVLCTSCLLITIKLITLCACLSQQKLHQSCALAILLSADWISCLNILQFFDDRVKTKLLLMHLLALGVVELHVALRRLQLRSRWRREISQRRSREIGDIAGTPLSARIAPRSPESTDSDDDRGPDSLAYGFHASLIGILGLQTRSSIRGRRQFLCAPRNAVVPRPVVREGHDSEVGAAGSADGVLEVAGPAFSSLPGASSSRGDTCPPCEYNPAARPLTVSPSEKTCVVCQEDIETGQLVRPLPRCEHKFHAHCLEDWAATMREETRCPTCRRPALSRKLAEGGTAVASLIQGRSRESSEPRRRSRSLSIRRGRRVSEDDLVDAEIRLAAEAITAFLEARGELPLWVPSMLQSSSQAYDFEVVIEKGANELGVDVVKHDAETLLISRITAGPVMVWNCANPQLCVRNGDRIVAVNDQRGDSELLIELIRTQNRLKLSLRRLLQIRVTVRRNESGRLGINIAQHRRSLRILHISPGPFHLWNARVPLDLHVQTSDHIVEVNGVRGTATELLQAIEQSGNELSLVLVRSRAPELQHIGVERGSP
mmetsp:Transcript_20503/g.56908  ORF Transcript_20503/g.56908 Transcript_20503/m.56908 type:complete len:718 (-) Transcript_20503:154-2307(-)